MSEQTRTAIPFYRMELNRRCATSIPGIAGNRAGGKIRWREERRADDGVSWKLSSININWVSIGLLVAREGTEISNGAACRSAENENPQAARL